MSALHRVLVVFLKELVDGLRDRRSLMSAMLFPLMAPFLSAGLLGLIVAQASDDGGEDGDEPELAIIGMEHAPNLVEALDAEFTPVAFVGEDPEAAVLAGDEKVVLRIEPGYADDFTAARPARVALLYDDSRSDASSRVRRVRRALERYSGTVGSMRLLARGVSPAVVQTIALDEVDLSTAQERGARLLAVIPMFMIMSCFMCSMYIAIDVGAGDRERGSLESLVLTPASPFELAVAKWGAAVVFGAVGVTLAVVLSLWACRFVDLASLDMSLVAGPREMGMFLLVCLPLTAFAAALQLLVATWSRSFKEAQTYLSVLVLVPMAPGMATMVKPMDSEGWALAVPALGQQLLLGGVLEGQGLPGMGTVLGAISCGVLALMAVLACGQLLRREQIVFGR